MNIGNVALGFFRILNNLFNLLILSAGFRQDNANYQTNGDRFVLVRN